MDDKASKIDDKKMMGIPEDFKIASADLFHGRSDHENECQSDDHTRQARNGGESHE